LYSCKLLSTDGEKSDGNESYGSKITKLKSFLKHDEEKMVNDFLKKSFSIKAKGDECV
jgi:hypothetical protein